MLIWNISEAKAQLSRLIELVQTGAEVLIGKAGKPVARLVPYAHSEQPCRPGALRGRIRIRADFDALPPDLAAAFGVEEP
jgi:prevent-host-death family protein